MSRGRRQVIQLNEPTRVLYSNEPAHDNEDDDDDSAGDMPTPERLVTEDMIPNRDGAVGQRMPYEIDNKVANFLAEIDALDPGQEVDSSITPAPLKHVEVSPVREKYSPAREKSPARTKPNAYSSMFVKGTPEFVHKPDERRTLSSNKKMEPWPEEPKTDWQQLKDESTNYPYYWNTVTNQVVWDMPSEFSQYLLRQKEYEEKVERGLREGTLDPEKRRKMDTVQEAAAVNTIVKPTKDQNNEVKPHRKHGQHSDDSADSSSDSSDSDHSPSHYSKRDNRKRKTDKTHEVSSSSVESSRAASHDKTKRSVTPELPDSTKTDDSKREPVVKKVEADDSIDFDIDDIDKELELALERKRQELMKMEEKKTEEKKDEVDKSKHKESRKKDERRHRDDDRRDERHRKHGKHRDRDSDRDRKRDESREEKKPKLTLKERLRIEMELKLEKERRKKKAIEDLMARELEQTVGGRSHKRHRDDRDKARKHYHHDDDRGDRRGSRDDYRDYDRGYDCWEERGVRPYDDRFVPPPMMKPPPPTDEMIAYEEERKSQLVDYGHGRSRHDLNGESDGDESRSADFREMEIKKLEALQLAELALSKLEFLEVTKKGLSKLQILLIELETRHQDWQAGGLTTNHFLCKLKEANWQLEQYEASAPPPGWVCCWDRYESFLLVIS